MQTKHISDWYFILNRARKGSGGRAARREARTNQRIEFSKYIERKIPNFEILNEEALEVIEIFLLLSLLKGVDKVIKVFFYLLNLIK